MGSYSAGFSPGITVAITATASPLPGSHNVRPLVSSLKQMGFHVRVGKTTSLRKGYLAGEDEERAKELMEFFRDGSVDAIVALRGGYGSMRLLPFLDFSLIKKNRKPFIGYSDNTALHAAFNRHAKMISFHGPNIGGLVAEGQTGNFARRMLETVFSSDFQSFSIRERMPKRARSIEVLNPGKASGRLAGGNLALLTALCGTPFFPSLKNSILFIEDIGEAPYRVDRMLTQLLLTGNLSNVAGIAIGSFTDCEGPKRRGSSKRYQQTIEDVLEERLGQLDIPIITGVPVGHGTWNATLPLGARAEIDARSGDLKISTVSSLAIS